jgi:chemotaxis protein MotB
MRTKVTSLLLLLGATLTGCVSLSAYRALQRQNDDLTLQLGRHGQQESDLADQATALTQQNIDLKMDKAAMEELARDKAAEYDAVTHDLRQEVGAGRLKITRYKDMLTLNVADEILFDSAKADLKPDGQAVLRTVAQALAKNAKLIRVVGHTDDQPLAKGAGFASNWELSTARATTVVRFLQDQGGLDPRRLAAIGHGEWMPVAPNDSPADRQKNRRIEILLVDRSLLDGSEGASPTASVR